MPVPVAMTEPDTSPGPPRQPPIVRKWTGIMGLCVLLTAVLHGWQSVLWVAVLAFMFRIVALCLAGQLLWWKCPNRILSGGSITVQVILMCLLVFISIFFSCPPFLRSCR